MLNSLYQHLFNFTYKKLIGQKPPTINGSDDYLLFLKIVELQTDIVDTNHSLLSEIDSFYSKNVETLLKDLNKDGLLDNDKMLKFNEKFKRVKDLRAIVDNLYQEHDKYFKIYNK